MMMRIETPNSVSVDQVTITAEDKPGGGVNFNVQAVRVYPFNPDGTPCAKPRVVQLHHTDAISLVYRFLRELTVGLMDKPTGTPDEE